MKISCSGDVQSRSLSAAPRGRAPPPPLPPPPRRGGVSTPPAAADTRCCSKFATNEPTLPAAGLWVPACAGADVMSCCFPPVPPKPAARARTLLAPPAVAPCGGCGGGGWVVGSVGGEGTDTTGARPRTAPAAPLPGCEEAGLLTGLGKGSDSFSRRRSA